MVCIRCEMVVKSVLKEMKLPYLYVIIGEVETENTLPTEKIEQFDIELKKYGLELLMGRKSIIVENIKNVIIQLVHYSDKNIRVNLSVHLSEKLKLEYPFLSKLFIEVKGITIEHFFILHRIERAKELMIYDELSLADIADKLYFSSESHLSKQFKKLTGITPTQFKQLKDNRRGSINNV